MVNKNVVVDIGSDICKAGFAGDDDPSVVFPCVVGRPSQHAVTENKDCFVGAEAQAKGRGLVIRRPVEGGLVNNWDDLEQVWQHTFKVLGVNPEQHRFLITENLPVDSNGRARLTQLMFETFNIPAMYLAKQAVLSLYASGRINGLVLDAGASGWNTVPIYAGNILKDSVPRPSKAGTELTYFLMKLLTDRGYNFESSSGREIVRDIKEKLCYVALDFEQEKASAASSSSLQKTYELPDGKVVTLGDERFRCPEALFQPSLLGLEIEGVPQVAYNTIMKCDKEKRKDLFRNIVLSGGCSLFPGMVERMQKEMTALAPPAMTVKVIARPDRKHSAWMGGATLAGLPTFNEMCITKEDYDEEGPNVVNRKCP